MPGSTFLAEIDLASLLDVQRPPAAVAPPRYPAALRDIAFVVDESVPWGDVRQEIEASGTKSGLESVALRDV